jgi:hypothetical protein
MLILEPLQCDTVYCGRLVAMCEVRLLPPYSTLRPEAVDSSVRLVAVYKIVWQRISEDCNLNINDYIFLCI